MRRVAQPCESPPCDTHDTTPVFDTAPDRLLAGTPSFQPAWAARRVELAVAVSEAGGFDLLGMVGEAPVIELQHDLPATRYAWAI
ncbi:hypothetical protein B0G75_103687 [Paraburkholderia sp. BL18I3N2]|uniref:hypothetical protein n=1 Tax=Paraburkholderia sp. BL18I3N2 TaxID=1938799 RepID=UPI000D43A453|nr:hypothetical protein [Paraburkholderia sp. BL18I3N2]PRX33459.1 hypothetical protein B0G75_103687 [Paraburkholderia sp. BL18I3N2]